MVFRWNLIVVRFDFILRGCSDTSAVCSLLWSIPAPIRQNQFLLSADFEGMNTNQCMFFSVFIVTQGYENDLWKIGLFKMIKRLFILFQNATSSIERVHNFYIFICWIKRIVPQLLSLAQISYFGWQWYLFRVLIHFMRYLWLAKNSVVVLSPF